MNKKSINNCFVKDSLIMPIDLEFELYQKDKEIMSKYHGKTKKDFINKIKQDLFVDTSNLSWKYFPPIHMQGDFVSFYVEQHTLQENNQSLQDFYFLNNLGYRSDNFVVHDVDNKDQKHVLFAGCSITYGQGVPADKSWPYLTHTYLTKDMETTGFFNIATPGATNRMIMEGVYKYTKEFGVPDIVFILLPDMLRDIQSFPDIPWPLTQAASELYIMMVRDYLVASGAQVVMYSWWNIDEYSCDNDNTKFNFADIEYVKRISPDYRNKYVQEYADTDPKYLKYRAFDLAHPGFAEHEMYANLMYNSYYDI